MQDAREVLEAEGYLNAIPRFSQVKHTLEDLRQMLHILNADWDESRVIHVAGTNGKGSVCAFLDAIFRRAGRRTAVFTSPHLVSVRERFAFDGVPVSEKEFLDAFYRLRKAEPAIQAAGYTIPTYFEYLFLMFAIMVKDRPLDIVILETGLGGRLDATNCLRQPACTIITSISLDHMQYLGDTVAKIAGEKAGIIKEGVPLIYDGTDAEASAVIAARARELHAPMTAVSGRDYRELTLYPDHLTYRLPDSDFRSGRPADAKTDTADTSRANTAANAETADDTLIYIPFPAAYQAVNSLLALRAARHLGIPLPEILEGLRQTRWAGRMEQILPGVYVDGGHNEGGIQAFSITAAALAEQSGAGQRIMVFTVSSDKSYDRMLSIIHQILRPDRLILTTMESYRGLQMQELEKAAQAEFASDSRTSIEIIPTVAEALRRGLSEKGERDLLFCAGSLYLVGEIEKIREVHHV